MPAATIPITTLGIKIDTHRKARLGPTAKASMLVATAKVSSSQSRVGTPRFSRCFWLLKYSQSILPPINARSTKAIQ